MPIPRADFQGDGERFSLSLEERAGVRTVVSTNFVFGGRNGKTDLYFTPALTCVLSPGKRILAIPARGFSRGRRTILLLREDGERADENHVIV
jgi:hypothetical protein